MPFNLSIKTFLWEIIRKQNCVQNFAHSKTKQVFDAFRFTAMLHF